jgi:hypothetical protein
MENGVRGIRSFGELHYAQNDTNCSSLPCICPKLWTYGQNNSFLLKQVHGGTVVKIVTMEEYDVFWKCCTERKVPFFTHQADAKKPTSWAFLLGLPEMPVEKIQYALAEHGSIPDDIKPMNIRSKKLLEHKNFILYFTKGTISASNTGAFFRFRYFDIEKFQFRDSDINIGIGRLKKKI